MQMIFAWFAATLDFHINLTKSNHLLSHFNIREHSLILHTHTHTHSDLISTGFDPICFICDFSISAIHFLRPSATNRCSLSSVKDHHHHYSADLFVSLFFTFLNLKINFRRRRLLWQSLEIICTLSLHTHAHFHCLATSLSSLLTSPTPFFICFCVASSSNFVNFTAVSLSLSLSLCLRWPSNDLFNWITFTHNFFRLSPPPTHSPLIIHCRYAHWAMICCSSLTNLFFH